MYLYKKTRHVQTLTPLPYTYTRVQTTGTGHWADPSAEGEEGERARGEIERAVRLQEAAGLDILAHGAYDRADMVEVRRGCVCG